MEQEEVVVPQALQMLAYFLFDVPVSWKELLEERQLRIDLID